LWIFFALAAACAAVAVGWTLTRQRQEPQPTQQEIEKAHAITVPLPPKAGDAKPGDKEAKPAEKKPVKPETKPPENPGQATPPKPNLPEPRFTFYKILPEKESIVPENEIKNLKHEESLGKKPQTTQYLLQAGSFTNPQDADKLKARLSTLKIKSHIEVVKIENTPWSRVKIGPFASLSDADKVRTYLRNSQIDSVVQKSVAGSAQKPASH